MAKKRSPNYPTLGLSGALELMHPVFQQENRNKMSRLVLAQHMGYTSLNGRALSKIGAVRAFGLIEGTGDDLRVSDDAITAMTAPADSPERDIAVNLLAYKPDLFKDLRKDFPDTIPSLQNLRFNLVQRRFTEEAAGKAAKNYLETMALVSGNLTEYNADITDNDAETRSNPGAAAGISSPQSKRPKGLNLLEGQRELKAGLLSKESSFRLIVSGQIGAAEIERLIKQLELDKEILADDTGDDEEETPS